MYCAGGYLLYPDERLTSHVREPFQYINTLALSSFSSTFLPSAFLTNSISVLFGSLHNRKPRVVSSFRRLPPRHLTRQLCSQWAQGSERNADRTAALLLKSGTRFSSQNTAAPPSHSTKRCVRGSHSRFVCSDFVFVSISATFLPSFPSFLPCCW